MINVERRKSAREQLTTFWNRTSMGCDQNVHWAVRTWYASDTLESHALVYRLYWNVWNGPLLLLDCTEKFIVLDIDDPKEFRTSVVSPYRYPVKSHTTKPAQYNTYDTTESSPFQYHLSSFGSPSRNEQATSVVMVDSTHSRPLIFGESSGKEIQWLVEKGGFSIVRKDDLHGHRLYRCCVFEKWKNARTSERYAKSQKVAQVLQGKKHGLFTRSPIVQPSTQRLLLSIPPSFPRRKTAIKKSGVKYSDITKASNKSKKLLRETSSWTNLLSSVYIMTNWSCSKARKYGVSEARVQRFETYIAHLQFRLAKSLVLHDLCVVYTKLVVSDCNTRASIIVIQREETRL